MGSTFAFEDLNSFEVEKYEYKYLGTKMLDGEEVYVAGFKTGNQTTTLLEMVVTPQGGVPGADFNVDMNGDGIPEPHIADANGVLQPLASLIVKFNGSHWLDEDGKIWDDQVKFSLPDKDVFIIDAMAELPNEIGNHTSVGTVLFNMTVNPSSFAKQMKENTSCIYYVVANGLD